MIFIEYNIYKIYNDINNKIYIGQTNRSLQKRLKCHFNDSVKKDTYFYRAIRKYGKEHFFIELIDTATNQKELDEKEFYWICQYKKEQLYNTKFSKGKCGGDTLSHCITPEIRKKISESKLDGNNPRAEK